jgi:hypothetical protein
MHPKNCYPKFDASIAGMTGEEALPRRVKQKETIDDDCLSISFNYFFLSFCLLCLPWCVRRTLKGSRSKAEEAKLAKGVRREEKRSDERNGKNGHNRAAPGTSKAMTEMDEIRMNAVFLLHRLRRCSFIH